MENQLEKNISKLFAKSRREVDTWLASTEDYVYLPSISWLGENTALSSKDLDKLFKHSATHYADLNGLETSPYISYLLAENFSAKCMVQTRSSIFHDTVSPAATKRYGIMPVLELKKGEFERLLSIGKLKLDYDEESGVYSFNFGSYPQSYNNSLNKLDLDVMISTGNFKPTGRYFFGNEDEPFCPEFENINTNKRYVKLINGGNDSLPSWFNVEPIKWRVLNPENINRKFLNNQSVEENSSIDRENICIVPDKVLLTGMKFNTRVSSYDNKCAFWQNSYPRAYLNGYNIHDELLKGNGEFYLRTDDNYSFLLENSFLGLAFAEDLQKIYGKDESIQDYVSAKKKTRLQKLNPDTTPEDSRRPLTDTECIMSWINAGESVLLRGPSGIGKTERILNNYPDCIRLKLTNDMFPEAVVGSVNFQTGEVIPPNYAKQAVLACATAEERIEVSKNIQSLYDIAEDIYNRSKETDDKVVILLDELLNVKPHIQSLVYSLVLNKFVESGKGIKLPKNVVLVATGNQKKHSSVSYDMPIPLEKRFDHILDMEPKVDEWIYEYAMPNNIHPTVINYILAKQMESTKKDISYFYEDSDVAEKHLDKNGCRGKTNDPRCWADVSRILYNFEKGLQSSQFIGKNVEGHLKTILHSKLRDTWAEEFYDFYNNPTLTVEQVLSEDYTPEDLPTNINEELATIAGLLGAGIENIEKVREFIRSNCSPEHLRLFDMQWTRDDMERVEKLQEIKERENAEVIESNEEISIKQ